MSAHKQQNYHPIQHMTSLALEMHDHNFQSHQSASFLVTTHSIPTHHTIPIGTSKDLSHQKSSINQIHELYNQIHSTINDMDSKVEHVIKKHETQFLFAYRNHIKKIKKQLSQIKYKSQEQQKMFSSNDRIQYLQQQLAIFRQQTMKAYDKLDQKNYQLDILKIKVKDLEKQSAHVNNELKEYYKKNKIAEMNRVNQAQKVSQLQKELERKNAQIKKLTLRLSQAAESRSSLKQESTLGSKVFVQNEVKHTQSSRQSPISQSLKSPLKSLNSSVHVTSTNFYNFGLPKSSRIYDTDLKQWFLQCIKTVKRQIAQRNNTQKSLQLNNISSIEEFMMIDKLRLLEIFLQNQKLLTYMYERIFPDRLTNLRERLSESKQIILPKSSSRQPTILTERQQKFMSEFNQGLISDRYKTQTKLANLPKVLGRTSQQKSKLKQRNNWKANLVLKDGKLNISMM